MKLFSAKSPSACEQQMHFLSSILFLRSKRSIYRKHIWCLEAKRPLKEAMLCNQLSQKVMVPCSLLKLNLLSIMLFINKPSNDRSLRKPLSFIFWGHQLNVSWDSPKGKCHMHDQYFIIIWQGKSEHSDWFFPAQDSAMRTVSKEMVIGCVFFFFSKAGKSQTSMAQVPYNKLLANLASLSRTGECWPKVVHSVHTATTSGQQSPVLPSRLVSKRLVLEIWLKLLQIRKRSSLHTSQVAHQARAYCIPVSVAWSDLNGMLVLELGLT